MTIFLEVTKETIVDILSNYITKSEKKDNKLTGYFRKPDCGAEKREAVRKCRSSLLESKDGVNDKATQEKLNQFIRELRRTGKEISDKHLQNAGDLDATIDNISLLITKFYDQIEAINLLEIPRDRDPINLLKYNIAKYYTDKIISEKKEYFYQKLFKSVELTIQKDELAKTLIVKFEEQVNKLDKTLPSHQTDRKERVIELIKQAQDKNENITSNHSIGANLPTGLSVGFLDLSLPVLFQRHLGHLNGCLDKARKEIENDLPSHYDPMNSLFTVTPNHPTTTQDPKETKSEKTCTKSQ